MFEAFNLSIKIIYNLKLKYKFKPNLESHSNNIKSNLKLIYENYKVTIY
jgi:hypothetical protein